MNRLGRLRATVIGGVAALAVLAAMSPAPAAAADPPAPVDQQSAADAKIKPELRDQLNRRSAAGTPFWVYFGEQPDLTAASRIDDWTARGTAVAEALQRTADSAQRDVRTQLDAAGTTYSSFWATNAIRVTGGSLQLAEQLAGKAEVKALYATTSYDAPVLTEGQQAKVAAAVEWGVANINADDVWNQYGNQGAGITIANIDTGVQYDHPALVGSYRGAKGDGTFDHNYNWFDAAGTCGPAPCDTNGHGSHTMGTMAGGDGADHKIGVAPQAKWIAANGCCPSDEALITSGQWMLQPRDLAGQNPDAGRRPQIINNSWGSQSPSNEPFMEDITKAWAASGIFGVWSNGNSGSGCDTSTSPGSLQSNYSTGAYDADNTIADFSSRGSGQNGELKPNLSAPGVNVLSSVPGNGYRTASGTSMAAPHVAGSIALLWSAAPGLVGDIAATRALLDGTGVDAADTTCGGTAGDNNVFGEGRLDALALVDAAPVGDTGTLGITVLDAKTGKPVPNASLEITGPVNRERTAGADGTYSLPLPVGDYTVRASWFGYGEQSVTVSVTTKQTVDATVRLTPLPRATVSGTVTDGSGKGWPLYAKIVVADVPGGTFYTTPATGRYSFDLPAGATYSYTVEALYPGYRPAAQEVVLDRQDAKRDVRLPVDADTCTAPGYAFDGFAADFDHGQPAGWTTASHNANDYRWTFEHAVQLKNQTGGTGSFALGRNPVSGTEMDSSLTSPKLDLSAKTDPVISFRQHFSRISDFADVDLSLDGGATWQTVLHQTRSVHGPDQKVLPIPQAAGKSDVRVRFHYYIAKYNPWYWQVDDVFVGDLRCAPVAGGLVLGQVSDRNTGAVLNGAVVRTGDPLANTVRTVATAADAAVGDGFYWLFSPRTGRQPFGATAPEYQDTVERTNVKDGRVNQLDIRLPAGRLSVRPADVTATARQGDQTTARFTVTNNGTAPATVSFSERAGSPPVPMSAAGSGAEVTRVAGDYSPLAFGKDPAQPAGQPGPGLPPASPWVGLTEYPTRIMDNAVGLLDGRVYSVGGVDGDVVTDKGYVYDPATKEWAPIANLPAGGRENASGAVIGDRFYVSGGWEPNLPVSKHTYAYDPGTDSWTQLADAPVAQAASGTAVLDGKLYRVGGCTAACDGQDVQRYDPATDSWDVLAPYPLSAGHLACGAIDGKLYCAGGAARGGLSRTDTYVYDPATNSWAKKASLPIELWGMGYTTSYGQLLVSGGITAGTITNEGFSYDPAKDAWTPLAASSTVRYRGGSACGLNRVGGSARSGFMPTKDVELLPTYGDCVPVDVDWLSVRGAGSVNLAPGRSITVTLRLGAADLKPGSYDAGLWIRDDTPYLVDPVDVNLRVS